MDVINTDADVSSNPAPPFGSSTVTDETDQVTPFPTMFKDLIRFLTLVEERFEGLVLPDWHPRILAADIACNKENLAIALQTIIEMLDRFRAFDYIGCFTFVTTVLANGSRYGKFKRNWQLTFLGPGLVLKPWSLIDA